MTHSIPHPLLLLLLIFHSPPSTTLLNFPTTFPTIYHKCTLDSGHHWPIQFHSNIHCHCPFFTHHTKNYITLLPLVISHPPPPTTLVNSQTTFPTICHKCTIDSGSHWCHGPSNSTATVHLSPTTTHHSGKLSNQLLHNLP